ncbi:PhoU domain-containing protein [Aeromicrobium sp. UC242_57]|uniref:PhoU domain-containing protein n=1 Tax=Aeromicrobium sp. UC242_57 TaxID=3374624 RepID=UPI0037B445BA
MRDQYYEQLDAIVDDLVNLTGTVRRAVADATKALLEADGQIAESVIAGDKDIDETTETIEERTLLLLATQQPVATDLRQRRDTADARRPAADGRPLGARRQDRPPSYAGVCRTCAPAPDDLVDGGRCRLDDRLGLADRGQP